MITPAPSKVRRKTNFRVKISNFAIYAGVFSLLVAIISIGYNQPQISSVVANAVNVNPTNSSDQPSVDNVVAVDVAAGVAKINNMSISDSVSNLAVTVRIKSEIIQSDGLVASKPQIIESIAENRLVTNYIVLEGDTVNSLAVKFKISAQTIMWANNLTTDALSVGSEIKVLPINGVLYAVKTDDTIDSIAEKYTVDKTRLVLYNDLDVSGLKPSTSIILPDATLPLNERPGYVAPAPIPVVRNYNYTIAYGYSGGDMRIISSPYWGNYYSVNDAVRSYLPQINDLRDKSSGNTMALGNCTWWAWERRLAIGRPLPGSSLGNAGYWGSVLSSRFGYSVDKNIEVGAVFESSGHVGIVERINYDDAGSIVSFNTSEMNVPYINYQVVERTVPASNINDFNYIH